MGQVTFVQTPSQTPRAQVLRILRSMRALVAMPGEAPTVSKVVNMQTHPGFFKAASLMSLLLAAESRAELQILCSNLEMMAGQPRVGVLNLTFCPVSAGLTAFAACPVCGKEK